MAVNDTNDLRRPCQAWTTNDDISDHGNANGTFPRYAGDDSQRMIGFVIMAGSAILSLAIACIVLADLAG